MKRLLIIIAILLISSPAYAQINKPYCDLVPLPITKEEILKHYPDITGDEWDELKLTNLIRILRWNGVEAIGPIFTKKMRRRSGIRDYRVCSDQIEEAREIIERALKENFLTNKEFRKLDPDAVFTVERIKSSNRIIVRRSNGIAKLFVTLIGIEASSDYFRTKMFLDLVLGEERQVSLEFDVQEMNKSGNLLAYVYTPALKGIKFSHYPEKSTVEKGEGRYWFLNAMLIKHGYASPTTIPPNVKYADLFQKLYQEAREQKRGLWSEENRPSQEIAINLAKLYAINKGKNLKKYEEPTASYDDKSKRWIVNFIGVPSMSGHYFSVNVNNYGYVHASGVDLEKTYTVERVIDGDTLKLTNGKTVQLIGIQAPEDEKMGQEATVYVRTLLEGKIVRLDFDVHKIDKYGRLLADVYTCPPHATRSEPPRKRNTIFRLGSYCDFINAQIVYDGYATPMIIPPNVKHAVWLERMYVEAGEKKRGLWKERPLAWFEFGETKRYCEEDTDCVCLSGSGGHFMECANSSFGNDWPLGSRKCSSCQKCKDNLCVVKELNIGMECFATEDCWQLDCRSYNIVKHLVPVNRDYRGECFEGACKCMCWSCKEAWENKRGLWKYELNLGLTLEEAEGLCESTGGNILNCFKAKAVACSDSTRYFKLDGNKYVCFCPRGKKWNIAKGCE